MQPTIHVIATTVEGTCAAIGTAVPLAKGAGARLVVNVPHIVPYALDLAPHVEPTAFFVRRYRDLVKELGGDACIEVCVCRTLDAVLAKVRAGSSVMVIGGPVGRWLTSPEERLANQLSRSGSRVVFVPAEGGGHARRPVRPDDVRVLHTGNPVHRRLRTSEVIR